MVEIQRLVERTFPVAECPIWDELEQRLYWASGDEGEIWSSRANGSDPRVVHVGEAFGSMAFRRGGGFVLGLHSGFAVFEPAANMLTRIETPHLGEGVRLNDGKVDAQGRFVCGAIDMEMYASGSPARGHLYRLDPDRSVHVVATGVGCANGPSWSIDDTRFYFTDSFVPQISVYPWDREAGRLGAPSPFSTLAQGEMPDGSTIDAEGYYWTAMNGIYTGVGELRRIAPDGTIVFRYQTPVAKITSLCFGGPELDVLFVTSMRILPNSHPTEHDGSVFAIAGLGFRGRPPSRYAG